MPEVKNVLPVIAATPVAGNSSNSAVSQGNDGQPSFSQVLRDKQASASASASARSGNKTDAADASKGVAKDPSAKAGSADGKAGAAQKDDAATATAGTDGTTQTPAELAQLLASAGLMANAQNTQTASAEDAAADILPADATKAATDASLLLTQPKTDKTAATDAAAAASLAAGTATTTSSVEQALAAQAQSAKADGKADAQTNFTGGDQQGSEKQPLLGVANQAGESKAAAATLDTDTSFSAALDRAAQNAGAQQAGNVTQTQSSQAPASTHTITTPVGRQGWADEVGQRVLWTAKSDSSRADLILTPPQLGRIEVSIHMNGDQANASFMAANPIAREALQDAMPKLRELMSQAGIQLGQADVSAGQSGQSGGMQGDRRQGNGGSGNGRGTGMLGGGSLIGGNASGWTKQGSGLVDTFA